MTTKLILIWLGWLIGGVLANLVLDLSAQQQIKDAVHVAMVLGCVRITV